ncbi:IDEAL domain-containing protein [Bacillus sp. WMMC1349]|uniref:IDEAL domain-containing protein n=1 Tax=Bacillus sp. WMMC1349 TaxID=2736254 RepID=UPI001554B2A8|nr:IDEAL domain-containing protein [Bacillus sp. WMMC1349]NPC92111.1 IDEAL domain-containing protein [Bacillus sp. WMMC1349]
MKDKKSYTELMKSHTSHQKDADLTSMDIYIQMILDESLYKRRLHILTEKINEALDSRDKQAFLELSKEYIALKSRE